MWVPMLLGVGFAVAVGILLRELSSMRGALGAWRIFGRSVSGSQLAWRIPVHKWCSAGLVEERCAPPDKHPSVSQILRKQPHRTATQRPPAIAPLPSRPGLLVRPEFYSLAPPLPGDGLIDTHPRLRSVEVDVDELIDTLESVALTAAEAEAILAPGDVAPDVPPEARPTARRLSVPPAPLSFSDLCDTGRRAG